MLPVSGADELVASGAMRMAWPMTSAQTEYSRLLRRPPYSPYWALFIQSCHRPRCLALSLRSSMTCGYDFQRSLGSVEIWSWKTFSAGMHSSCARSKKGVSVARGVSRSSRTKEGEEEEWRTSTNEMRLVRSSLACELKWGWTKAHALQEDEARWRGGGSQPSSRVPVVEEEGRGRTPGRCRRRRGASCPW